MVNGEIKVNVFNCEEMAGTHIDETIFDLEQQIASLSSNADLIDYMVAVASGVLCGMMDILWVGEFDLSRGREYGEKNGFK